jgi:hypothetical protein
MPNHLIGKRSSVLENQRKYSFDVSVNIITKSSGQKGKEPGRDIWPISYKD